MCLENVSHKAPKIATKDIICYKLLYDIGNGKYITPFRMCKVTFNEVITCSLEKTISDRETINEGIHTFGKLKEAEIEYNSSWYYNKDGNDTLLLHGNAKLLLVKANIPKGSLYWRGDFFTMVNNKATNILSYCSDQIIYLKEIEL
jgi:hypothetical protein